MTVETVRYSDFEIWEKRRSVLGLRAEVSHEVGFLCPRCKSPCPPLDHGGVTECSRCGLYFQRWGNALDCSDLPLRRGVMHIGVGREE